MGTQYLFSPPPAIVKTPHSSLTVGDRWVFSADSTNPIPPWGHTGESIKMNRSSSLVTYLRGWKHLFPQGWSLILCDLRVQFYFILSYRRPQVASSPLQGSQCIKRSWLGQNEYAFKKSISLGSQSCHILAVIRNMHCLPA